MVQVKTEAKIPQMQTDIYLKMCVVLLFAVR